VAQTVTIGEQKVCPQSESLKFSTTTTPTPHVENPSDSSTPIHSPDSRCQFVHFSIKLLFLIHMSASLAPNARYVAKCNELVNFDRLLMTVVVQNVNIEHFRINFLYPIAYTSDGVSRL